MDKEDREYRIGPQDRTVIRMKNLDWIDFDEETLPDDVDVILGTDLIYSMQLLPHLAKLIGALLKKSKAQNPTALIACTQRSREFITYFLEQLALQGDLQLLFS